MQPQGYVFPRDWAEVTFGGSPSGIHGACLQYDQSRAHPQHDSPVYLQCGCTSRSAIFWYSFWDHSPVMGTHDLTLCRRRDTLQATVLQIFPRCPPWDPSPPCAFPLQAPALLGFLVHSCRLPVFNVFSSVITVPLSPVSSLLAHPRRTSSHDCSPSWELQSESECSGLSSVA